MTSLPRPASGRLNAFQRVMHIWGHFHPYNAAHAYRLNGPLRLDALRDAVRQTWKLNGLGVVELSSDGLTYHHEPDHEPPIEMRPGCEDGLGVLGTEVNSELNRSFERPRVRPFRFSVIAGPQSHWLTLTYDHWLADSAAARLVMRHVLGRYLGWRLPENCRPLNLYPGTYREVFADRLWGSHLPRAAWGALVQWAGNRTAAKVAEAGTVARDVRVELYRTQPGTADRLRRFARSLGASVHDVFLAAVARATARYMPPRPWWDRSPMSLGSIVDVRADADADLGDSLGAFLAYYLVRCKRADSATLGGLAREIAAKTGPIKSGRRYLDSILGMRVLDVLWRRLPGALRPHLLRQALPMTAGLTNILVRDRWLTQDGAGSILEYLRIAPLGPMLPLVFTPTTFEGELNLTVTYRPAGFTEPRIRGIISGFLNDIENPAGELAAPCVPASPQQDLRCA